MLVLHGILARRGALNIGAYGPLVDRAMAAAAKPGHLVLDIESPGGSPVQSDLIAARIRRGAEKHKVKVTAVIGEVGASGGYWLACAADRIVANPMSIVGSIGVVSGGFGFEAALFDGGFMLGARALEHGLIDGLGDVAGLVRELGGEKAVAQMFGPRRRGLLARLPRLLAEAEGELRGPRLEV